MTNQRQPTKPQPNSQNGRDQTAKIENPRIAKFYKDGLAFIKMRKTTEGTDPCFAIKPGMPQWNEWVSWFNDRCGRIPLVMRSVETGRLDSFTVPAEKPEWFDRSWRTEPQYLRDERAEDGSF